MLDKDLKELEITIEKGELAGCLVYHGAIRFYIKELIKKHNSQLKKLGEELIGKEKIEKNKTIPWYKLPDEVSKSSRAQIVGYNQKRQEIITTLKKQGIDI